MCSDSPELNLAVDQPFTKEVCPAECSGNDDSLSLIPAIVIGDCASQQVDSHFHCQNSISNLPEETMARSEHDAQSELDKDVSFDDGNLPVPSTALQTMKRADSLPSSLLRYAICAVLWTESIHVTSLFNLLFYV